MSLCLFIFKIKITFHFSLFFIHSTLLFWIKTLNYISSNFFHVFNFGKRHNFFFFNIFYSWSFFNAATHKNKNRLNFLFFVHLTHSSFPLIFNQLTVDCVHWNERPVVGYGTCAHIFLEVRWPPPLHRQTNNTLYSHARERELLLSYPYTATGSEYLSIRTLSSEPLESLSKRKKKKRERERLEEHNWGQFIWFCLDVVNSKVIR